MTKRNDGDLEGRHGQRKEQEVGDRRRRWTVAVMLASISAGLVVGGCARGPIVVPGGGEFLAMYAGGQKRPRPHRGVDYQASAGTVIIAAGRGHVFYSDKDKPSVKMGRWDYGRKVSIIHDIPGHGLMTKYAHLGEVYVDEAEAVEAGQPIGTVGRWMAGYGTHLHFEVWDGSKVVNPATKIGGCHDDEGTNHNDTKPLVYPLAC